MQIYRIYVPGTCGEISIDVGAICDLICKSEGLSVASYVCSFLAFGEVWICSLNAPWQAQSRDPVHGSFSVSKAACDLLESV